MYEQTPSQTVGPFFSFGLVSGGENILVDEETAGERIYIAGRVLDGDGQPVSDALLEIWQADHEGIYPHPNDPRYRQVDQHFRGFGRAETDPDGRFRFKTIKPGPVPWEADQRQAPHVNVRVFARGMLLHAVTRLYFSDEAANQSDPVLNRVDPARRRTLIATCEASDDLPTYRFDIFLQGDQETLFFDP